MGTAAQGQSLKTLGGGQRGGGSLLSSVLGFQKPRGAVSVQPGGGGGWAWGHVCEGVL